MRFHIYLSGLNAPPRHWAVTEVDDTGTETKGYVCWHVKINVPSWTLHIPKHNRWVIECEGKLVADDKDTKAIKDLYEIVHDQDQKTEV